MRKLVAAALITLTFSACSRFVPENLDSIEPSSTAHSTIPITTSALIQATSLPASPYSNPTDLPLSNSPEPVPSDTPQQTSLPTAALTLTPAPPQQVICGNNESGRKVYIDDAPAFAIRQGPGCEYDPIQVEITKTDPLRFLDVLGIQGDWLLVDLCNDLQGWVFAPSVASMNIEIDTDQLPIIDPPATPANPPTAAPLLENSMDEARATLTRFIDFLNRKEYKAAAQIFSGGYGIAIMWNSDVDPNDHAELLMRACEWNGFQCFLRINRIVEEKQVSPMEYYFVLEFLRPDGELYQRNDAQNQPITRFGFRVVRDCDGRFLVVTWPFYEQYGG